MGPHSQPKAVLDEGQTKLLSATAASPPRQKKLSPYLFTHHSNALTFRIRVPADLQACLGKTEYRRSLGRCYAQEAKQRALRLATAAFDIFSFARESLRHRDEQLGTTLEPNISEAGRWSTPRSAKKEKILVAQTQINSQHGYTDSLCGRPLSTLTDSDIRSIAQDWLLTALKGANLFSLQAAYAGGKNQVFAVPVEYQSVTDTAVMSERKFAYQDALKACRVDKAARDTDALLTARGIRCDQSTESVKAFEAAPPNASIPYLRACQELMKASTTFYSIMEQTSQGNYGPFDIVVKRLEGVKEKAIRERVSWIPGVTITRYPFERPWPQKYPFVFL